MNSNIAFFKDDDPRAGESLADMLERTSQPVVGLILKVEGEHIVNWMLADPLLLKSLAALSLPSGTSSKE
ncbi:MAG: hypothetical protein HRF47_07615 [Chloroflexota bacterium]|jgi:hypothetical protein